MRLPKEALFNYLWQRMRRYKHALHATPGVLPHVSAAPELMKRYGECRKGVGFAPLPAAAGRNTLEGGDRPKAGIARDMKTPV